MSGAEAWGIEPLASRHDRGAFDCGEAPLNDFLKKYARQNEERGISRTYVAVQGGKPRVLGYYTPRAGAVEASGFPMEEAKRLPRYPVPVIHLARLAVDRTVQGQGVGQALLASALKKAVAASELAGAFAVEVFAKTDKAVRFYAKHGFKAFQDDTKHLYLPVATIARLIG
jgi:GNAT superfamily N-acetyltransferase